MPLAKTLILFAHKWYEMVVHRWLDPHVIWLRYEFVRPLHIPHPLNTEIWKTLSSDFEFFVLFSFLLSGRIVSLGRALLQLDGLEKVHTRLIVCDNLI